MKILRKYATMTFLLVSAAIVIPAYSNSDIIVNEQENVVNQQTTSEETEVACEGKEPQKTMKLISQYAKDNYKIIIPAACYTSVILMALAEKKYNLSDNKKLNNLLGGLGAFLILLPMHLVLSEND